MKIDSIVKEIKNGKTLYISTYLKCIKINNKTLLRWEKAGFPLLKDGKENETGFYIAAGKRFDYVMPEGCSIKLI